MRIGTDEQRALWTFFDDDNPQLAALHALEATYTPSKVALTTIILAIGFLVFASSGFELSWALGLLVTITIVFAILTDFLLLPPRSWKAGPRQGPGRTPRSR